MPKYRSLLFWPRFWACFILLTTALFVRPVNAASGGEDVDQSTPRRALTAFMTAARAKDYSRAARLLDLTSLSPQIRDERGQLLAAQLSRVLEMKSWVEPELLSDQPEGNLSDGTDTERVGVVSVSGADVPILLSRSTEGRWSVSATTLARVPHMYEMTAPGFIEARVPAAFHRKVWGVAAWQWLGLLIALATSFAIGRIGAVVAGTLANRLASKTVVEWDNELAEALRRPARFFFALLAFNQADAVLALSPEASEVLARLVSVVTIGVVAWALVGIVEVVSGVVERRAMAMGESLGDAELRSRGVKTQVRVLRRVANVALGILALALMLTQFEVVRSIGVSLLASAGVAGVVLGFAAQRTIGSLLAGLQLSFTQPIRIGDVVIVEKEWGTIEEITLTFVIVRIWDERRLIIPMTRFLEQPFENWTKVSPQLHGTVFFHVDFRLPIDDLRRELDRIVEGNPLWDGRTKSVCVTNAMDRTLEVRALVSAANSGDLWNLRVEVRERIVAWLQKHEGGRYLPVFRVEGDRNELASAPRRPDDLR
ncbi:MAG TPA: mechanosensitive ion channel domain-containing protein [Labilithrix sp.]|nr:mechanosensitive ion channel domain-containing protein [Labilithrix sp.]